MHYAKEWSSYICHPLRPDICQLPMVVGPCSASFRMFYFDVNDGRCHEFDYGGCLGNKNRCGVGGGAWGLGALFFVEVFINMLPMDIFLMNSSSDMKIVKFFLLVKEYI